MTFGDTRSCPAEALRNFRLHLPPAALEDAAEAAEAWRQQALEHLRESLSRESREKRKRSTTLHRTGSFDFLQALEQLWYCGNNSGKTT